MGPVNDFRDLKVWQLAMDLAVLVLQATPNLPLDQRFGLGAQLRDASASIPNNIAEGYGRGTRLDYLRFLRIARGSANELTTMLILVGRLGYLRADSLNPMLSLADRVRPMLTKLIKSLES